MGVSYRVQIFGDVKGHVIIIIIISIFNIQNRTFIEPELTRDTEVTLQFVFFFKYVPPNLCSTFV